MCREGERVPEVGEDDVAIRTEEEVGGLDISMDDATRVQGIEGGDLASALALKVEEETEEKNAQFQPRMS